jgi:uridine kinase
VTRAYRVFELEVPGIAADAVLLVEHDAALDVDICTASGVNILSSALKRASRGVKGEVEMIGDKLVITDYHRNNGQKVAEAVLERLKGVRRRLAVAVAGESGSGKSETAATCAEALAARGLKSAVLGQDDYFKLPPKSNAAQRREDILRVGTGEVRLDLLDAHLKAAKEGADSITKPLVYFDEDRIGEELLSLLGIDVVIAEGTYTGLLKEDDIFAFIDATYHHTLEHRRKRARDDAEGDFIEKVLEIEHRLISPCKGRADIILPPNPEW